MSILTAFPAIIHAPLVILTQIVPPAMQPIVELPAPLLLYASVVIGSMTMVPTKYALPAMSAARPALLTQSVQLAFPLTLELLTALLVHVMLNTMMMELLYAKVVTTAVRHVQVPALAQHVILQ